MAAAHMDSVIRHLRRTVLRQDDAGRSDAELLASFISQTDDTAFAALARRHGPMVFGVCRRVIGNHHDAEDAFQATFLILARKASTVRPRERVANWLHGVALRTALRAKSMTAKRQSRERHVTEMPEPEALQQDQLHDLKYLLDQELNGLPENYRLPILLCDLEGRTIKEAARQLGWPQGTVAGRLARGRKHLAKRLASRGVVLSAGLLAAVVSDNVASAGVPNLLMSSTVKAATLIAAGQVILTGAVPAKVAILMEGVLTSMFMTKLKAASLCLLLVATLSGTAGLIYQSPAAEPSTAKPSKVNTPPTPTAFDFAFPIAQQIQPDTDKKQQNAKAGAKPNAPRTDLELFQGIWTVVSIEQEGKPRELEKTVFMVDGKRACLQTSEVEMQGGLYLDVTSKPRSYDFVMSGKTVEGIYSFEGDTLCLCFSPATDAKRPLGFFTEKGSSHYLFKLKRVYEPEFPFRLPDGTKAFPTLVDRVIKTDPLSRSQPLDKDDNEYRPTKPPKDEPKNKGLAEFYERTGHPKTAEFYHQKSAKQENKPSEGNQTIVPPAKATEERQYVLTSKMLEVGDGQPKEILGLPKVTAPEGQLAQIHIIDVPQNLLAKVIEDEKIKIGAFLDMRVKRLQGTKVRLILSLQKNEMENSSVDEIRVVGTSLQSIHDVELHKPVKLVFEKDANGKARRWIEITVDEQTATDEQPVPPPSNDMPPSPAATNR